MIDANMYEYHKTLKEQFNKEIKKALGRYITKEALIDELKNVIQYFKLKYDSKNDKSKNHYSGFWKELQNDLNLKCEVVKDVFGNDIDGTFMHESSKEE